MTEGRDAPRAAVDAAPGTRAAGPVAQNVLDLIGRTPLVRLAKMETPPSAQVWGKAEFLNPARSVKDRPALSMIQAAEAAGRLQAGATLIEATSGNTGISLAMIAAVRGYRCVLVMPEDMSLERRHVLRAYGAEIALTAASDGMLGAVRHAEKLVRETPGAFMPRQFENPANPASHYAGTANEIVEQLAGRVDAFVAGVGTGGTLTGVARCLRERVEKVLIVAVEPKNSPVLSGGRPGLHAIQGLGAGFVPAILDRSVIDEVVTVSDVAAERAARRLAQAEGLLVGPS
ncbi:MAG TPA: cysteine synthase A, partial [Polyangiaceae bacterium]|nr:cysteine synthase A [Polyangiaceae bacterium]